MRIAMLLHKSVEFDSRVRREASALAADGHQVFVVELAEVPDGENMLEGFHRRSAMPSLSRWRRLPPALYRPLMLAAFVRAVKGFRPQIIHAHDAAMLLPGIVGARLTGARLVYDSHELATGVPYRERGWAWLVAAIERLIVPRCAAVITVSDGIATALQDRYRLRERPIVVRNVSGLKRNGQGDLRRRLGLPRDAPLVLHQGAPAPGRGCEVLLDAAAGLDGVHVAFLGDPEPGFGQQLRDEIAARGLGDRVSLLPSVPLDRLLADTAEADVGVTLLQDTCENHRLALPNKLFEYIAAGVPVVASALPETEALVNRYGVGWCVRPDDGAALAAAVRAALGQRDDPALRVRLDAAGQELSWNRERARLLELYDRVVHEAGPGKPLALLLVRNSVSHDGRVLRAARTAAAALGGEALVVGVAGGSGRAGETVIDGVRVRRLSIPGVGRSRRAGTATPASAAPPADDGGRPTDERHSAHELDLSPLGPRAHARLPARVRLRRTAVGGWFALRAVLIALRLRPELVHANDWNTMWGGTFIKLVCRSRLVYDSHELWADRNGRWENRAWLLAAEAMFVRIADQVITTSPGHAEAMARRYRTPRPLVVRNIPDWAPRSAGTPRQPPTIVYVGGLMPGRGLEQMVDALPRLPDVTLRAIGPGSARYRSQLERRARAAGVESRVQLCAPVLPPAIPEVLQGASIGLCLIQPVCRSYELSLPNKLLEYAAAEVPVLASDLPIIAKLVRDYGLGAVVPPDDSSAIAAAARSLLVGEGRDAAIRGARAFTAANTWEGERALLAEAYQALIAVD
jgi:glycosyltransferase involved in cell wall biosynthesis